MGRTARHAAEGTRRTIKVSIDGTPAAQAAAEKKAEIWLKENGRALESSNEYVERHGLPSARYRNF